MKWFILVYLTIQTNIGLPPDDLRHKRIELPITDFSECMDISDEINDIINRGKTSSVPYVRSFYWAHKNILKEIKAECVFGKPLSPSEKWEENEPWLWRKLDEDHLLTPEPPPQ
jgi:hypothetical protein